MLPGLCCKLRLHAAAAAYKQRQQAAAIAVLSSGDVRGKWFDFCLFLNGQRQSLTEDCTLCTPAEERHPLARREAGEALPASTLLRQPPLHVSVASSAPHAPSSPRSYSAAGRRKAVQASAASQGQCFRAVRPPVAAPGGGGRALASSRLRRHSSLPVTSSGLGVWPCKPPMWTQDAALHRRLPTADTAAAGPGNSGAEHMGRPDLPELIEALCFQGRPLSPPCAAAAAAAFHQQHCCPIWR